jgi:hypothetical protein
MLELNARSFLTVINKIINVQTIASKAKSTIHKMEFDSINPILDCIRKELVSLSLPISIGLLDEVVSKSTTHPEFADSLRHLFNTISLELKNCKYYRPMPELHKYYDNPALFGTDVFNNFASANNDITEAGTCLSLDRATACVLHLMRVVEAGLTALANTLGIKKQNDWAAP